MTIMFVQGRRKRSIYNWKFDPSSRENLLEELLPAQKS